MSGEKESGNMAEEEQDVRGKKDKEELPQPWKEIQGAVWMIGIAILFWQGWWWPGILVLAAISGLVEAGLRVYVKRQQEQVAIDTLRRTALPDVCPKCGSPLAADTVKWTNAVDATCPYCGSRVTATNHK